MVISSQFRKQKTKEIGKNFNLDEIAKHFATSPNDILHQLEQLQKLDIIELRHALMTTPMRFSLLAQITNAIFITKSLIAIYKRLRRPLYANSCAQPLAQ